MVEDDPFDVSYFTDYDSNEIIFIPNKYKRYNEKTFKIIDKHIIIQQHWSWVEGGPKHKDKIFKHNDIYWEGVLFGYDTAFYYLQVAPNKIKVIEREDDHDNKVKYNCEVYFFKRPDMKIKNKFTGI
jgi:hypothetical protein